MNNFAQSKKHCIFAKTIKSKTNESKNYRTIFASVPPYSRE